MYKYEPPFLVVKKHGETVLLSSLEELANNTYISYSEQRFNPHTNWWARERLLYIDPGIEVTVIYDLFGRKVDTSDIPWDKKYKRKDRNLYKRIAASKGLPIPGTGNHKRGRPNYFRRPRYVGLYKEKAAWVVEKNDLDVAIKGKIHRPPQSWDDIRAGDYNIRNWKQSRKTQWK